MQSQLVACGWPPKEGHSRSGAEPSLLDLGFGEVSAISTHDEPGAILLIDDDALMLDALGLLLEDEGYRVARAASGLEAIEQVRDMAFDLIVSDVRMAGMDGIQTLTSLRDLSPTTRTILITGYASPDVPVRAIKLGVDDYLLKPFDDREFVKSVRRSMDTARRQHDFDRQLRQQWRDFSKIIRLLAAGLEARDPYFEGHSTRVAELSARLGRELNLSAEQLEILDLAAHLHDIGNLGSKLDIFTKADALVAEEVEELRGTTRRVDEYLKGLTSLRDVFRIILHHHEWFNGEGVPFRLQGDAIPLESRVLCVAEAYDAMVSPRPYREQLNSHEAMQILQKESGEHFDPDIVGLLARLLSEDRLPGDAQAPELPGEDEVADEAPTENRRIGLLLSLAHTYLQNSTLEIAHKAYQDCLALLGEKRVANRAEALNGMAFLCLAQGETDKAARYALEAVAASRGLNDLLVGRSLTTRGFVEARQKSFAQAGVSFREARRVFEARDAYGELGRLSLFEALVAAADVLSSPTEVRQHVEAALALLSTHALFDVPARDASLFTPLLVRAYAEGWNREALEPFLVALGSAALAPHLKGLDATLRSQVQALLVRSAAQDKSVENAPTPLSVYCFGKFRVFCGGREVGDEHWKTRKAKYLFAYLACSGEREVPDEKLMEMFWPDHDPDKARQNFYSALSHIRKALEGFLPQEQDKVVVAHKGFYRINASLGFTVDAREFERHFDAANQALRAGNSDEAQARFQRAEALYLGEFLEGYYSDWALGHRDELERKYQELLNNLMRAFVARDRHTQVVEYCQKLLGVDPCDQEAHLALMKAHVGLGRPEQAVRQYQQCSQILKSELNMSPSSELASYYLSIKG